MNNSISIVIPAYNERERIQSTLNSIYYYLEQNRDIWPNSEVIVVSDGSIDDTDDVVSFLKKTKFPDLKLISYIDNKGKGYAIKKGVMASQGQLVLFADADGATPIEELNRMAEPILQDKSDIVIASRRTSDANVVKKQTKLRQVIGQTFSLIVRVLLHIPYLDTQCGFKLFKGDIARELFTASKCNGFAIDIDIIYRAMKKKYRIEELGVSWIDGENSKVNPFRDGIKMLGYTVFLCLKTKN